MGIFRQQAFCHIETALLALRHRVCCRHRTAFCFFQLYQHRLSHTCKAVRQHQNRTSRRLPKDSGHRSEQGHCLPDLQRNIQWRYSAFLCRHKSDQKNIKIRICRQIRLNGFRDICTVFRSFFRLSAAAQQQRSCQKAICRLSSWHLLSSQTIRPSASGTSQ